MSVLKHLAIHLLILPAIGMGGTSAVYAQSNTPTSFPAKAKPPAPAKRAPVRRPPAPAPAPVQQTFGTPAVENDSWFEFDYSPNIVDDSHRRHQIGVVGVVSYFGSGVGAEYLYNLGLVTVGATALFTSSDLEDEEADDAKEFFETKSMVFKAHARYKFLRYMYVGGGVGLDRLTGTYGWRGSAINGQQIETDFSANLPIVDLFVGSEIKGPWGLYIGVDWVGTSFNVGGKSEVDDNPSVDLTSKALKGATPAHRIDEEARAQLQIYYLNFRIGLNF
ncbi:MAG: hypothetical protein EOP10_06570 [Proteobacteria bacterium]|nr:MAG: hypothetical protein EOP10_06570 [Pseudomonadota bacterium]